MKIEISKNHAQESRTQMAHVMSQLLANGWSMQQAARFAEDFRGKLAHHKEHSELIEMHVLTNLGDIEQVRSTVLLRELKETRLEVKEKIDRDGYCIVIAASRRVPQPIPVVA